MAQTDELTSTAVKTATTYGAGGGGGMPTMMIGPGPVFQQAMTLRFKIDQTETTETIAVPPRAALEIEMVTACVAVAPGEQAYLSIDTVVGGVFASHDIRLQQTALLPQVFEATQCAHIYADAGSKITVRIHRTGFSDPARFKVSVVTLSGRIH